MYLKLPALLVIIMLSFELCASAEVIDDKTVSDYENITVTGQRPPSFYKDIMIKAEVAFFDSYNNLTNNEEFKITCFRKPINEFSRLTKRVCEAGFISEEQYKGTQRSLSFVKKRDILQGNMTHTKESKRIYQAQKKQRELQLKEMAELIQANPALYEKYAELQKAKQDYEESKSQSE